MEDKMYILVNSDIKISKGKLAGQVGHAVSSYMFGILKDIHGNVPGSEDKYSRIKKYMAFQKKVVLKCPESILVDLEETNKYNVIRDKGITHLKPNTLTCVNLGLYNDLTVPEWVKELKLY